MYVCVPGGGGGLLTRFWPAFDVVPLLFTSDEDEEDEIREQEPGNTRSGGHR